MAGDKYLSNNGGVATEKAATQVGGVSYSNQIPALNSAGLLDASMLPSLSITYVEVSTSGTLLNTYRFVLQTVAGIISSLWASPVAGDNIIIKNTTTGSTVVSGNGINIEGNSSITLLAGESVGLLYNGTQWLITSLGNTETTEDLWVDPPASCTSTGKMGQMAFDGTYRYDCVATNTWVRYAVEWTF